MATWRCKINSLSTYPRLPTLVKNPCSTQASLALNSIFRNIIGACSSWGGGVRLRSSTFGSPSRWYSLSTVGWQSLGVWCGGVFDTSPRGVGVVMYITLRKHLFCHFVQPDKQFLKKLVLFLFFECCKYLSRYAPIWINYKLLKQRCSIHMTYFFS